MADIYSIKDPAQSNVEHNMYCIGQGYGTCETAQSASGARIVTLANYKAVKGFVSVAFKYSVSSSATMNINGAGAYPIKFNGQALPSGKINRDSIATFYFDGSNYNLVNIHDYSGTDPFESRRYDFYVVSSSSSVITDGNDTYLLLEGENGSLTSGNIFNGTEITIVFDLQGGVEGLAQAGLTQMRFKFENSSDTILEINNESISTLSTSDIFGAKYISAIYNSADGEFYLSGIVYETTDTATSGSNALMTSGGVYDIIGDIESILASI